MTCRPINNPKRRKPKARLSAMSGFGEILILIAILISVGIIFHLVKLHYFSEDALAPSNPEFAEQRLDGKKGPATIVHQVASAKQEPSNSKTAESPGLSGKAFATAGPGADSLQAASSLKLDPPSRAAASALQPRVDQPANSPTRTQKGDQPDQSRDDPSSEDEDAVLTIAGRVRNDAGEALSGIEVILKPHQSFQTDGQSLASVIERRAHSNWDGFYEFDDLSDGEYELRTIATDLYAAARSVVPAGVVSADLVLSRLWELTVRGVIEDFDGPVANAIVSPVAALSGSRAAVSDEQGSYKVTLSLKPHQRSQTLRFRKQDYKEQQLQVTETQWMESSHVQLDVLLEPIEAVTVVTGNLWNNDGEPVAGETVVLESAQLNKRYRAVTDAVGSFSLTEVAVADDYWLYVRPKERYQDYSEKGVRIIAGILPLDIVLQPVDHGRLSGLMIDSAGKPIPDFSIWVRSLAARQQAVRVNSDKDGFYVVENVPPGDLIFESRAMPNLTVSGIALPPGAEERVNLILDQGQYDLYGQVVDSQGLPVPVPEVFLDWSHQKDQLRSNGMRKTATDEEGYFQFTQLGPGPHKVRINMPGFRGALIEHKVGDQPAELVVQLEEQVN